MQARFFISTLMSGLLQILRTTLNDRFHNKHSSRQEYYSKRRLLNDSEEAVLTDWMDTLAMQGLPFNTMILARALKTSEDGTNAELTSQIQKHVNENQDILVNNPHFLGLFATSRHQIKRNLGPRDEPANPPQHQPALPAIPTYPNTNASFPFAHTNAGEHASTSSATQSRTA